MEKESICLSVLIAAVMATVVVLNFYFIVYTMFICRLIKLTPKRDVFVNKFWWIGFICLFGIIYYYLNGRSFKL